MGQSYAARHRAPGRHRRPTSRTSLAARALRRPAVTASVLLATVATSAAGYQASDARQTGQAAFTVSAEAIEQANELSDVRIEDDARLASERNQANATSAALLEKERRTRLAAEAAAAKARKERAERAARAKERAALEKKRQAVIARAKQDPKAAARALLSDYGWSDAQFTCLDKLWVGESNWNYRAENSSSGAYGIPQSLPASKMASVGADYRDNPLTQIKWGLGYIKSSYGSPCNAWDFWQRQSPHWY